MSKKIRFFPFPSFHYVNSQKYKRKKKLSLLIIDFCINSFIFLFVFSFWLILVPFYLIYLGIKHYKKSKAMKSKESNINNIEIR